MKLKSKPPAESGFVYRSLPPSGNKINGLGEKSPRRASYVFHSNAKTGPLPWDDMQAHFRYTYPGWMLPELLTSMWLAFRPQGKVSGQRREVNDPAAMAAEIKAKARDLGTGIVGICKMRDEFLVGGTSSPYRYVIAMGLPMDREIMLEAPHLKAGREVLRVYQTHGGPGASHPLDGVAGTGIAHK